jgi:hypothetical protein
MDPIIVLTIFLSISFISIGFLTYNIFKIGRKNKSLEEKYLVSEKSLIELDDDLKKKIRENDLLNTTIDTNKDSHSKTSNENEILKDKNENLVKEVQKWESWEKNLSEKYKSKSDRLDSTLIRVDANEEKKTIREKEEQQKRIKIDLRTWQDWEATVENKIRLICDENILKYISQEDYPSEKKPDNYIEIANQFIIFDAKSPKSHDKLDSFKKTKKLPLMLSDTETKFVLQKGSCGFDS